MFKNQTFSCFNEYDACVVCKAYYWCALCSGCKPGVAGWELSKVEFWSLEHTEGGGEGGKNDNVEATLANKYLYFGPWVYEATAKSRRPP